MDSSINLRAGRFYDLRRLLHLFEHAQEIATPDLSDLLLRVAATDQLLRDVQCLECAVESLETAAD